MANEFKVRKGLIVQGSGSIILDIQGSQGELFSVTDSLSGSLFSVNDISGIPIMEVFSDNTIKMGTFNNEAIIVSGSRTGMGIATPQAKLHISGANNDSLFRIQSPTSASIMFVSGSGNIGIGTGTPTNTLQVVGGITATSITASIISASSGITGSLLGTSSWAQSASNAINAQTASFLPVGTYQITSSWAQSASNAINAQTASFLPVGTYQITSSWAVSASQALTASFLPVGTYQITSSWAQSASNAINAQTASFLPVETYQITSSWAVSASNSINARTSSNIFPAITNNTSTYVLTATGNGTINGNSNLTFDGSDLTLGSSTGIVLPSNGYVKGPQSTILLGGNATYNVSIPNDFVTATASFGSPFSTRIQLLTNVESIPGGYDSGSIFFKTPSGSGMTYTNEGRLGIGISNPINTLQIQGNVSASSYTGSLLGTSSWAVNALTASFVDTASTNAFVQNGNSFGTTALLGTNDTQDLQLETSGSVRMTISSSGNVGIGTTAPLTRLHISGANSDSLLRIQSPASASIMFVGGSGNVGLGTLTPTATLEIASTGSATLGQAQIYLNATAVGRNRIDFNTIGLGVPATTTRSDGTKITLYPAISATNTDIALGVAFPLGVGEFWSSVYNSSISFSWYAAATQIMRLAGDGQLRLGAGSAALPVISAGLSGTDTNTGIYFPTADTIGLVTGGTERARITSAGSASIGTITSTPSATLHVSGANNVTLLRVASPSSANALIVSGSGNVGIGTGTPTNTLQVVGGITTTSITASIISASSGITGSLFGTSSWAVSASQALTASFLNGAFLQNGNSFGTTALLGTNDSQSLQFETSGSVRMTISSSGNIGIHTSAPTQWIYLSTTPSTGKYLNIDAAQTSNNPPDYGAGGGGGVDRIIGNTLDNFALGTPDYWMEIKLNGGIVLIPAYLPA